MSVREYIGARYVPLFMGEWDNDNSYEPLSIVSNEGNSYTSRQFVPIGIDIDNDTYWAETGNFNAQVEAYRQEVLTFNSRISELEKYNPVNVFATVEEMANSEDLAEGMICKTLSYYENENGNNIGGCYYIISRSNVANGIDIIDCGEYTATAVIDSLHIRTSQLGAKGYENDDTSVFERASELLADYGELIIDIPFSIVSRTIELTQYSCSLIGECEGVYAFIYSQDLQSNCVFNIRNHGFNCRNISLRNISANNDMTNVSESVGFYVLVNATGENWEDNDCTFQNCNISFFNTCIEGYGKNVKAFNCTFVRSKHGLKVSSIYNGVQCQSMRGPIVSNCTFHGGIYSLLENYVIDEANKVFEYPVSGVVFYGYSTEIIIENCNFNSTYFGYMYCGASSGLTLRNNRGEGRYQRIGICALCTVIASGFSPTSIPCCIDNNFISAVNGYNNIFCYQYPIFVDYDTAVTGRINVSNNNLDIYPHFIKSTRNMSIMNNKYINGNIIDSETNPSSPYIDKTLIDTGTGKCTIVGNVFDSILTITNTEDKLPLTSAEVYNTNYENCNAINGNKISLYS